MGTRGLMARRDTRTRACMRCFTMSSGVHRPAAITSAPKPAAESRRKFEALPVRLSPSALGGRSKRLST
eukprot:scaffold48224_cov26-Tisochrysis_lutea.AAC.2